MLTLQNMKMTTFWDTAPCILVLDVRTASIIRVMSRPDDVGSTHLWNVGLFQQDYSALYFRKLPSSYRRENLKSHIQKYIFIILIYNCQ
jgi:hypothetical protein